VITHVGQRLDERYLLTERIAVGGMGEVWKAVDEVLDREVAVKILRNDLASGDLFRQRFRTEARTAAMLSHPGIAAVYDYGEFADTAYLVMELVAGEPLSEIIAQRGALEVERTLDLLAQIARALHAAHVRGVVHRDVKPANVIVSPAGKATMTDFGIARMRHHESLTATGQVMGTAHYLAPEVARGETATPLSDLYALGVVGYECLSGWRPFDGANQIAVATAHLREQPPPLPESVPPDVRAAVFRALEKNPSLRPRTCEAFAVMLDGLLRKRRGGAMRTIAPPAATTVGAAPTMPRAFRPTVGDGTDRAGYSSRGVVSPEREHAAAAATVGAAGAPAGAATSTDPVEAPTVVERVGGPGTAPLPAVDAGQAPSFRSRADTRRSERGAHLTGTAWWNRGSTRTPLLVLAGATLLVLVGILLTQGGDGGTAPPAAQSAPGQPSLVVPSPSPSPADPLTTEPAPTTSRTSSTSRPAMTRSETDPSVTTTTGPVDTGGQAPGPERIEVLTEYYQGQPATDVARILGDRGMVAEIREESSALPAGSVVRVEPEGLLVRGSTVVVVASTGG